MKVLWFSNVPLPAMLRHAGREDVTCKGHWVTRLLESVTAQCDIEFAVVAAFPGLSDARFTEQGVSYYTLGQARRANLFGYSAADLRRCVEAVGDFGPDLIHIHGTERFYGMLRARKLVSVPTVVSIQGLLGVFARPRIFFGALSPLQVVAATRVLELPARLGLPWQYYYTRRAAAREALMLAHADAVMGRTGWDCAYLQATYPDLPYHHVGEIMRSSFYRHEWSVQRCERHSLIYTNAGHPSRGTEDLLEAVALLRRDYPQVRLRLAGTVSERSGYGRYLRRRVAALGLADCVEFTGFLDEDRIRETLLDSHVFVISSYIENSPNSLAEAMLIGMPGVASCTGGIPDMLEQGRTGLMFPVGDVPALAGRIREIFEDDGLARELGAQARRAALPRHDPATVTRQLLGVYDSFSTAGAG